MKLGPLALLELFYYVLIGVLRSMCIGYLLHTLNSTRGKKIFLSKGKDDLPSVVWGNGREYQGCLRLGEIPVGLHARVDSLSMIVDGLGSKREKDIACSFTLVAS